MFAAINLLFARIKPVIEAIPASRKLFKRSVVLKCNAILSWSNEMPTFLIRRLYSFL
jgi:hypothetical protein